MTKKIKYEQEIVKEIQLEFQFDPPKHPVPPSIEELRYAVMYQTIYDNKVRLKKNRDRVAKHRRKKCSDKKKNQRA